MLITLIIDLYERTNTVLDGLVTKGRVKVDGKVAILPKSTKNKVEKEEVNDEKVSKKRKTEPTPEPESVVTQKVEVDKNPSWGKKNLNTHRLLCCFDMFIV